MALPLDFGLIVYYTIPPLAGQEGKMIAQAANLSADNRLKRTPVFLVGDDHDGVRSIQRTGAVSQTEYLHHGR